MAKTKARLGWCVATMQGEGGDAFLIYSIIESIDFLKHHFSNRLAFFHGHESSVQEEVPRTSRLMLFKN